MHCGWHDTGAGGTCEATSTTPTTGHTLAEVKVFSTGGRDYYCRLPNLVVSLPKRLYVTGRLR
jgi:hypothetical protein